MWIVSDCRAVIQTFKVKDMSETLHLALSDPSTLLACYLQWAQKVEVYATWIPVIGFRGHARSDWRLLPSLIRGHQKLPVQALLQFEGEIIDQFRRRYSIGSDQNDLDVLAYAQHHCAPTRLLDWSRSPVVALWFAVCDKSQDHVDGRVFRLFIGSESKVFSPAAPGRCGTLQFLDECKCGKPIHLFSCPATVDRSDRQDSIFSAAKRSDSWFTTPLDGSPETARELTYFDVPAREKRGLRRLLVKLGLDAFSIYGDPDSFGKSVAERWDFTGITVMTDLASSPPNSD